MSPGLLLMVFLVALLYSSVGHGGASGYLAALALFGFAAAQMKAGVLLLNILVAGIAFLSYRRAGHFDRRIFWPFALGSVPMAFLGGLVSIPAPVYSGLLAVVLVFASTRLAWQSPEEPALRPQPPSLPAALGLGGGIGLLSGIVGVGGGIFLSPLMILLRWADAKRAAAASAAFIWVNSAAALYGPLSRHGEQALALWPLALAAATGGLAGSTLGARRLAPSILRRLLALVLLIAAFKLGKLAVS